MKKLYHPLKLIRYDDAETDDDDDDDVSDNTRVITLSLTKNVLLPLFVSVCKRRSFGQ